MTCVQDVGEQQGYHISLQQPPYSAPLALDPVHAMYLCIFSLRGFRPTSSYDGAELQGSERHFMSCRAH